MIPRWFLFGWLLLAAYPSYAAPAIVMVLGDSLSAGYGLARGESWVDLLQTRLDQANSNARVVNASITGDTTDGALARLPKALIAHRPRIVVIELGGNDGLRGQPIEKMRRNLQTMVTLCQRAGAKVLLVGMQLPPNYGPLYTQQFAQTYVTVSERFKLGLVPFFLDGIGDKRDFFQADQIHPNAKAQPILLDNVWAELKKLL